MGKIKQILHFPSSMKTDVYKNKKKIWISANFKTKPKYEKC